MAWGLRSTGGQAHEPGAGAGVVRRAGRVGERLIEFANGLVARFRGGLGQATVVGATVFGGVSGSAVASASALGSIMIPWQRRAGYPAPFCAALNASAPIIDLLIPPSISVILYALVVTDVTASAF